MGIKEATGRQGLFPANFTRPIWAVWVSMDFNDDGGGDDDDEIIEDRKQKKLINKKMKDN